MRTAAKVDANQKEIVDTLRKFGCSVISLGQVGKGCPDLLVGYRAKTYLLEVKQAKGKVSESQTEWHDSWRGGTVFVVRTSRDALDALQL